MFRVRPSSLLADRGSSRAPAVRSVAPARSCNASQAVGLARGKFSSCPAHGRPGSYPRSFVHVNSPFVVPFAVSSVNPSLAGRKSKCSLLRNDPPIRCSPTSRRSRLVQAINRRVKARIGLPNTTGPWTCRRRSEWHYFGPDGRKTCHCIGEPLPWGLIRSASGR